MKTKTIEDYYCTSMFSEKKIHITYGPNINIENNYSRFYKTSCGLSLIVYHRLIGYITFLRSYKNLCKTCIKRLPDNIRKEVIYNYVLAKVKL